MSQQVATRFDVYIGTDDAIIIQINERSRETGSATRADGHTRLSRTYN